jgi:hypothetical protein
LPTFDARCVHEASPALGEIGSGYAHGKLEGRRIERRNRLSRGNRISDIDRPLDQAADQAEAEIGLEPRLDRPDELDSIRSRRREDGREDRTNRLRDLRLRLAPGRAERRGKDA